MYVLVPDDKTPAGIEYARRYFARIYRPVAGVWTVESGEFQAGWHLNVLSDWSDEDKSFKGHIYKERVRTHVRAVASYMSKAERAATREEGFARSLGAIGTLGNYLRQLDVHAPVVAGAQVLHEESPGYLPPAPPGPETYHDTARRWLAPLYQAAHLGAGPQPEPDPPRPPPPPTVEDFTIWKPDPPRPLVHPTRPEVGRAWCAHILSLMRPPAAPDPAPAGAGPGPAPPD